MKKITLIIILVATLLSSCSKTIEGDLIIKNVNIIDVETGNIDNSKDVVIISDSIASILDHKKYSYKATEVIDGTDKFLIPGLWDMHTHTWWGYKDFFPLLIANGVTGIREMQGDKNLETINFLKEKADSLLIPDIVSPESIVDGAPPTWSDGSVVAKTPQEGREIVRRQKQIGADFIKVYFSLRNDVYKAIADECKKQDIPLAGHIPSDVSLSDALKANHSSIEHFWGAYENCSDTLALQQLNDARTTKYNLAFAYDWLELANNTFDKKRISETIRLLRTHQSWICPTLVVHKGFQRCYDRNYRDERVNYMPSYVTDDWPLSKYGTPISEQEKRWRNIDSTFYQNMLKMLKPIEDAGVGFLAGSDYPNPYTYPGFSLHEELQIFVDNAGFTTLEALQTATLNPALFLKKDKELGTVEIGKTASLVLLYDNPLEDIKNTQKISGVILRGKYLDADSLKTKIETIATKNRLPKIKDTLLSAITKLGIDQAIKTYHELKVTQKEAYNFDEDQLNSLAYKLMESEKLSEAIIILELNSLEYPEYANGYDSLGDAYLANGQKEKAAEAWKQAVALGNITSKKKLKTELF